MNTRAKVPQNLGQVKNEEEGRLSQERGMSGGSKKTPEMANSAICVRGEMLAEREKEGIRTLSILKYFDFLPLNNWKYTTFLWWTVDIESTGFRNQSSLFLFLMSELLIGLACLWLERGHT